MPEVFASNEVTAELLDPVSGSVITTVSIPYRRDLTISERPVYAQRGYHRSNTLSAANLRSTGSVSLRKDADSLALAAEIKRWQKGVVFYALSSDLKGQRYRHPHLRVTFTNADGSTDVVTAYNVKLSDRSLSAPDGGIVGDSISLDVLGGFEPKDGGYEPVRALDFHRTGIATYLSTAGTLTTAGDGVARITADGLLLEGAGKNWLANSGGEAGDASGWTGVGMSVTSDPTIARHGERSLRLQATADGGYAYQEVDFGSAVNGRTFTLSLESVANSTVNGKTLILAVQRDLSGVGNWAEFARKTIELSASNWRDAVLTATISGAHASSTKLQFLIGVVGITAGESLQADVCQFEESPFRTSYIDNPNTSGTATRQPDLCGIVPLQNELAHSHDLTQGAVGSGTWNRTAGASITKAGSNNTLTLAATSDAIYQAVTPSSVASTTRMAAAKLKLGTLSGSVRLRLLDQAGNQIASTTINSTSLHATDARTFYVTGTAAADDTGLQVQIIGNSGTGTVIVESLRLVRGNHPGIDVETHDTPIYAPPNPALDPALSQNGRMKVRILPPPISTGKTYGLIGAVESTSGSNFALWRWSGVADNVSQIHYDRRHNGGTAGRGALAPIVAEFYDGALHDVILEWTNEVNESTGVREMWQRLYIDGVKVAEQDVAALYGAATWADIDPSRLISDGNCFAVLSELVTEYPAPRAGYRPA